MTGRSCETQRREGSGVKRLRRLKVSGMKLSVQKINLYCKHGRGQNGMGKNRSESYGKKQ